MPDDEPKQRGSFLRRKASIVPRKEPPKKRVSSLQTMTREEKETFGDLLEQLGSMRKAQKPEATAEEEDPKRPVSEEEQTEMSQISDIFDAVLKDMKKKRPNLDKLGQRPGEVLSMVGSQQGTQLGKPEANDGGMMEMVASNRMSTRTAAKLVARRESAKIEHALRDAINEGGGDTGVWEVCKKRIFSMLQYLGERQGLEQYMLPGPAASPSLPADNPDQKPESEMSSSNETQPKDTDPTPVTDISSSIETQTEELPSERMPASDELDLSEPAQSSDSEEPDPENPDSPEHRSPLEIPSFIPPELVVTVLYPRMLLVAFRLINTNFPNSPLISQFRSTIRSHGRVSYVLGSSTGIYNELLYFQWRGCNDLPGVVTLLREMDLTGVEPNRRTRALIDSIVAQRDSDIKEHGEGENAPADPWWDMAPNRKAMREITSRSGFVRRLFQNAGRKEKERTRRERRMRKTKFQGRSKHGGRW